MLMMRPYLRRLINLAASRDTNSVPRRFVVDHFPRLRRGHEERVLGGQHPSVVHQDVDGREPPADLVEGGAHRVVIADVEREVDVALVFERGRVARETNHLGALGQEVGGNDLADAPAGPGHHRDPACVSASGLRHQLPCVSSKT